MDEKTKIIKYLFVAIPAQIAWTKTVDEIDFCPRLNVSHRYLSLHPKLLSDFRPHAVDEIVIHRFCIYVHALWTKI